MISKKSISDILRPALFKAIGMAFAGLVGKSIGAFEESKTKYYGEFAWAASAKETIRARGFMPN